VRSPRKPPTARRSRLAARPVPAVLASPGHDERSAPSVPPRFCCWVSALHRLAGVYVPARTARRVPPPRRSRPTIPACGRSPHRPRPFRAKMNLVSTPASPVRVLRTSAAPTATDVVASRRTGNALAARPGGSARGAGWGHLMQARSRSRPRARSRRRERERADGSVGRCRRKTAM